MPKPRPGEIWLVRFPFTDLSTTKVRPALILATHGSDIIIVGIFSRMPSARAARTWIRIDSRHAEFRRNWPQKDIPIEG
jgi:mRNA interferase MazF